MNEPRPHCLTILDPPTGTPDLIDLMRAVMCAIGYVPPRFLQKKGSKHALDRTSMTELETARHGVLLLRANEVNAQLCKIRPEDLAYETIVELHGWTALLRANEADSAKTTVNEAYNDNNSKGGRALVAGLFSVLPPLLKAHLQAIVNCHLAFRRDRHVPALVEACIADIAQQRQENEAALKAKLEVLLRERAVVEAQLRSANSQCTRIWGKLDAMSRLKGALPAQVVALEALRAYLEDEQGHLRVLSAPSGAVGLLHREIARLLGLDACRCRAASGAPPQTFS